ncbi:MAG: N-6 DNA methylase [Chlorobiaceae bacterium]|nr:N-6 DNA methylase [Chlorobiaceae bacterium]
MKIFIDYIKELQETPIDQITEHSKRASLENLLKSIVSELPDKIKILHEPKREGKFGSPDFKITITESIIGYIENKKIEENLDKILKTDQIEKYKKLSENLILTNYIEWIWIKEGVVNKRANLCYVSDIENKKFKPENDKIDAVLKLIKDFFSQPPIGITDSEKLADALAIRAKHLKEFLLDELLNQEKKDDTSKLTDLYITFRDYVFDKLTLSEFSDAFSQTLVYGLFLAKLNADTETVTLYNAKKFIPQSFELIKELVNFLDELDNDEYKPIRWIVEEVLTVVNNLDLRAIYECLSFSKGKKDKDDFTIKDPYVYFYEDFLKAYDYDLRKSKGVYYTPPPVVNFIVRGINDLLKSTFEVKEGFADRKRITVLDFATGTGTFLSEILHQIFETLPKGSGKRNSIIQEHILQNLFGFEYMIASYTIAHLKLSQYLKDEGYELQAKERFQIFLTNTLVPMDKQYKIPLLPALSKEIESAQKVKDTPVLVITGNPPYSKKSKNTGPWITELLKGIDIYAKVKTEVQSSYYIVDGKPLNERQNWLRDDYVKFIRFAQWKMQHVENGVIGIITNHTFLDNITFRGMRQSLLNTFDYLYFLDLHGSAKRQENTPDSTKNENVFDIEQGVSISFFVKKSGLEKKVFHADMWGTRVEKYRQCFENSIDTIDWKELKPSSPYYFFVPRSEDFKEKYSSFWSVTKIFKAFSLPLMSGNDTITVHFTKEEVEATLNIFKTKSVAEIKSYYKIEKESSNWTVLKAKNDVVKTKSDLKFLQNIAYRPFDKRITYFTGNSSGFHSRPGSVSKYMLFENIGLLLPRQLSKTSFQHAFCTDTIPEMCCISTATKEQNQLFPLYLYYDDIFEGKRTVKKETNFTKEFTDFINDKYKEELTPEQILGYIYAVLHSETYRANYFEDLQVDFAKIPFTSSIDDFSSISDKGTELLYAHLLKKFTNYGIGTFMGEGTNTVEKIDYNETTKSVFINNSQYFDNVSSDIYEFKIGGYEPIDKYLKSHKERILSLDEIETIENIINVIFFTIEKMEEIEELTKDWI